jgi:hypothetical protein
MWSCSRSSRARILRRPWGFSRRAPAALGRGVRGRTERIFSRRHRGTEPKSFARTRCAVRKKERKKEGRKEGRKEQSATERRGKPRSRRLFFSSLHFSVPPCRRGKNRNSQHARSTQQPRRKTQPPAQGGRLLDSEKGDQSLTIAISTRRDSFFEDFGSFGPNDEYSIRPSSTPFVARYWPTLNERSKPRW